MKLRAAWACLLPLWAACGGGGSGADPIVEANDGWGVAGKADDSGAPRWSSEVGLEARMTSTILPYFAAHARAGEFVGRDGVPIRYVVLGRAHERAALVISSGRTETYLDYAELAYDLRNVGVSIYILDHRGQGFSGRMLDDPQRGYVYDFSDYVADFGTFMDDVVAATPHGRVLGLAHSMGGAILASYLEQQPGRFDAVVLVSPMMEINAGWLSEGAAWAAAEAATAVGLGDHYAIGKGPFDLHAANDLSHSDTRYGITRGFTVDHPEVTLGGPTYRWIEQAVEGERAARGDAAAQIDAPVLLLQAGADSVVKPDGQATFCGNAPDCTLVTIDGSGHSMLQENDALRGQTLDAMAEFFARN
jgi:lysophospholipase